MSDLKKSGQKRGLAERLDRLVAFARAALLWEKLWRALVPPLLIVGLFLAVSFAGLWLEVGGLWRMIGVFIFAAAFGASLYPFSGLARPSRQDALSRIDRSSGVAHRPASSLDDALANVGTDPATQALWRLHLQRMARNVEQLRAGLPSPRMVDFDRYALRAGVLVALIASAFIAGPEKYARVASAFDWRGAGGQESGYRVDAWIDPPAYTGKAPILLKLASNGESVDHAEKVSVPVGSTITIRSSGGIVSLETAGALDDAAKVAAEAKAKQPSQKDNAAAQPASPPDPHEHHLVLRGDAQLTIQHAGAVLGRFDLSVIPDNPPSIELTDVPRPNLRGSLTLSYKIDDDYGVISAFADFSDPSVEGVKGHLRSLIPPPRVALALPPGQGRLGETEMTTDLSDNPWAGARVKMALTATDEGGNDGKSDPIYITLPEKRFLKPLAHALAEQRRNLVLYPDDRERVEDALEALMVAPEAFDTSTAVYLGLDVATRMLQDAKNDTDLIAVSDFLWSMALQIENGDLSDAERDLRAAEQQLRDALQRNAPDDEIRKLTENLRAAMDKYLNEFAKQQQQQRDAQQQQQQQQNGPNNAKSISRKDLQAMLDRMQDMARAGDKANAQKMLEQLQNTLDNLAMAQHQKQDPAREQMSRALNELDKMMREQQQLRDKTHRQAQQSQDQQQQGDQGQGQQGQDQSGQQQQGEGQQGQGQQGEGQQGAGELGDQGLSQEQQALRDRLQELEKQLRQSGQGEQGLDDADRAMQEAQQGLSQGGDKGNSAAEDAQGRALEGMRKGAEQLAQKMQGQGQGQGDEDSPNAEEDGGTDPLGRPMGGDSAFNPNSRYDPMGLPAAQRAQRVLEELRRRLADPSRPQEELDYLERLLRRY
ncbi:MAG: TIGR02302 family protein [Methylovirgula sp.]